MNLMLFEPALIDFGGHYNRYVRVLAAEAANRGIKLSVAGSERLTPSLREALERLRVEVIPAFPELPYRMQENPGERERISHILAQRALACLSGRSETRVAWLSGTGALLGGASLFAEQARIPFALQMIDFAQDWPKGHLSAPADLRERTANACAKGMKVYVQSPLLARTFEDEVGVVASPFPAILDFKPRRQHGITERPTVGIMNMLRTSKRPWIALDALISHAQNLNIVLHLGQNAIGRLVTRKDIERMKSAIGTLIPKHGVRDPKIKIVVGILPAELYQALWHELDCSMMSYDVERYSRQGSGMLFESLADGIIPMAPLGSSMAEVMSEADVGITYDASSPTGLPDAVGKLVKDFASLARRSHAYATDYRRANSPSTVMSILLDS